MTTPAQNEELISVKAIISKIEERKAAENKRHSKRCVQCGRQWNPLAHDQVCRRCVECRKSTGNKSLSVHCELCDKSYTVRPARYYALLDAGESIYCSKCREDLKNDPGMLRKGCAVPCGTMLPAKIETRCSGFLPVGDSDGCPHYEQCLSKASNLRWEGFRTVQGRRDTRSWRYIDELFEHLFDNQ